MKFARPSKWVLPVQQKPAPATVRSLEHLITQRSRASLPRSELRDKASIVFLK